MPTSIHLASDHAGLTLKTAVAEYVSKLGYAVHDHGTTSYDSCDYPVFAKALCAAVHERQELGILICGTGIGMSMVANRMPGIRAALCTSEFQARATRQHNNANVLCLGERVTGQGLAFAIVSAFLDAQFEGGRHQRRIDLFDTI